MLYLENVSREAKLRFQEIREGGGGEPEIQLFSVICALLTDIRLDEFPRAGARKSKGGTNAPRPLLKAPLLSNQ